MKFPRSTHLFRGQLDLAPFLCVLFLLAFSGIAYLLKAEYWKDVK